MMPDIVGDKVCNLDCVYCELGPSDSAWMSKTVASQTHDLVLAEVNDFLQKSRAKIDHLVLISNGEVTLCDGLGDLITGLRRFKIPVAVVTNGARLNEQTVRDSLIRADAVMLSLDAAEPDVYKKICRPLSDDLPAANELIEHYAAFRAYFSGELSLMVVLVAGRNDRPEYLRSLQEAVTRIKPESVRLSTIGSPPADPEARAVSEKFLHDTAGNLSRLVTAEVKSLNEPSFMPRAVADIRSAIVDFLAARPATYMDIAEAFGFKAGDLNQYLDQLAAEGLIVHKELHHGSYYTAKAERP